MLVRHRIWGTFTRYLHTRTMLVDGAEYVTVQEGKAVILVPEEEKVFYNPIQQFNRDLSVMAIKAWSQLYSESKIGQREHKKRKLDNPEANEGKEKPFVNILEALSATGLRALRYGHEIPNVQRVVANDMLSHAVEAITRNTKHNDLSRIVKPNLGDAIKYMAGTSDKFHVIDLDPCGTAAPFIDSALQCVVDEGLLLVTCTDAGVLAGSGYPEKCFALYGGNNFGNTFLSSEANHEAGLRLMLHMIATTAAKYKKTIEPLLCLSIDFYFRIFIKVRTSPIEVKRLASRTMLTYHCGGCGHKVNQPLGRVVENKKFQIPRAVTPGSNCTYCESHYNIAGPMWYGQLHNHEFIDRVLTINSELDPEVYGTTQRIKGMLTLAKNELLDEPFYINLNQICSFFKSPPIPIQDFCRAVGNYGYNVSLTHAKKNCVKTNAPWEVVLDINRQWLIRSNKKSLQEIEEKLKLDPENEKLVAKHQKLKQYIVLSPNLTEGMVGFKLLKNLAPSDKTVDFETDNDVSVRVHDLRKLKMVRYQENPTKNWGPKAKPK